VRVADFQRPGQRRHIAYRANAFQYRQPLDQPRFFLQPAEQSLLRRFEHLQRAPAQTEQVFDRLRHFFEAAEQLLEISLPV
jgi:hypothetical protein